VDYVNSWRRHWARKPAKDRKKKKGGGNARTATTSSNATGPEVKEEKKGEAGSSALSLLYSQLIVQKAAA